MEHLPAPVDHQQRPHRHGHSSPARAAGQPGSRPLEGAASLRVPGLMPFELGNGRHTIPIGPTHRGREGHSSRAVDREAWKSEKIRRQVNRAGLPGRRMARVVAFVDGLVGTSHRRVAGGNGWTRAALAQLGGSSIAGFATPASTPKATTRPSCRWLGNGSNCHDALTRPAPGAVWAYYPRDP